MNEGLTALCSITYMFDTFKLMTFVSNCTMKRTRDGKMKVSHYESVLPGELLAHIHSKLWGCLSHQDVLEN